MVPPEGSGYYKADTSASWSVTPAEVKMSGVLGFLGGKMRAKNVEGTGIMTSPKTVTISWKPDYKMPILLVLLFIGLASYLGYRYAQARAAKREPCGLPIKCARCEKPVGTCGKDKGHAPPCGPPQSHPLCGVKKPCSSGSCQVWIQCSRCRGHEPEHNFPAHTCTHGTYKCICGANLTCDAPCHADYPNKHSSTGHVCPHKK